MVDLHCHILPGLDDGALDLADSIAMARQAESDGIEVICATPHIRHDHDVVIGEIAERVTRLNDELAAAEVRTRVAPGGEVAETAVEGLSAAEIDSVALGDGSWILLEPAPGPLGDSLLERTRRLLAGGYRVLIAHPERHSGPDIELRLAALVDAGALIQGTAAHMSDEAADFMAGIARRGLMHVLGSDAHSSRGGRPAEVGAGLERLGEISPALAEFARDAAVAIAAGDPLPPRPRAV